MSTTTPRVGDRAVMPFDGDVVIEIANVPAQQPHVAEEGQWIIHDQYGEEHLVELDAGSWVTVNPWSL